LSRQRVNEALNALEAAGMIRVEYGGLRILDAQALTSFKIDDLADHLTASRRSQGRLQSGTIKLKPTV
jgi:DNA-binding FadR family transcriptional regulator